MLIRVLGEIIFADAVLIMNFKHDQVLWINPLSIAQCKRMRSYRVTADITPDIDDAETTAGGKRAFHDIS